MRNEYGSFENMSLMIIILTRTRFSRRRITFPTDSNKQKFVALIEIQQTNFYIHKVMIKDGKEEYFHRHNFQVLSMDEWE